MSFDSSCGFLFYHLRYYGGCQYVKGTKQILIAVCGVEFTGLHSNFLVWKLQFYTVNFTVCSVNVFTVFLYFLHNYFSNHSSQNYFVKTTDFFFYSLGSLSVGHSESRRMTDEIGISPERPIHFECN